MTNTNSSNSIKVAIVAIIGLQLRKLRKCIASIRSTSIYTSSSSTKTTLDTFIYSINFFFFSDFHVQSVNALFTSFFSLTRTRSILSLSLTRFCSTTQSFFSSHIQNPGDFIELFKITSATI